MKDQKGFTLVEVVWALWIFAIASLALTSVMIQGKRPATMAREELDAREAMRGVLTDLLATPFDELDARSKESFILTDLEVPGAEEATGTILVEDGPEGLDRVRRLRIRVEWVSDGRARSIETVHFVSDVYGGAGAPSSATATTEADSTETAYYQ